MKSGGRSRISRGRAKTRIHEALLNGAQSIDEIRKLGIPKATVYRVLGQMEESGEVSKSESLENGNMRTVYVLKSGTLPANPALLNETLTRVKSSNINMRQEALRDLKVLSKEYRVDASTLKHLITIAEAEHSLIVLEVLTSQAVHAKKDENPQIIRALQTFIPTASKIVADTTTRGEVREQALLLLQLTADSDQLAELAIKIIAAPSDPALSPSEPTQFGIIIRNICVEAARRAKYRSKIYDLLLSENNSIVKRAQEILSLSREPPLVYS